MSAAAGKPRRREGGPDELGAHVSTSGGVRNAPERAARIGAACLQMFTKQPSRWAEPEITEEDAEAFAAAREEHGIGIAVSHDSYLINLSAPDRRLWRISQRAFEAELRRSSLLGLEYLVSHPGNATDGDLDEGVRRNARGIAEALGRVGGPTRVLLEHTAGAGTTVGGSFERIAAILGEMTPEHRARMGVCVDTCHLYSAGYDLAGDWDGVWKAFDRVLGLDTLHVIHVNDSKTPFASRRDRHEHLGAGWLGPEPFRRLMLDERLLAIPKILETPKDGDAVAADRANLAYLRAFRGDGERAGGRRSGGRVRPRRRDA